MLVYVLTFLVAMNHTGVERTVLHRHFYTHVGCAAVAHTINRAMEAQQADPGTYAACVGIVAEDEL